ncbi:valine--tRNA ligase [Ureaplasma ceti]|uniref:Valine--tRNA ligase n=1 Tax=Ureaplasma ceti TaxID=3119530 RepID=A0ABP9U4X0_9BACT
MKELDKKFNPQELEKNRYDFWLEHKLFAPTGKGEPFSIILPPPNVTGRLHLGHAWDVSLQDTLIRYKKLQGFDTLWVPGTDHAGIATQTKFEKILKETEHLSRHELGREKFLEKLWAWKEDQANFIRSQWRKMGIALSYDHEKFTMDEDINEAVNHVFVTYYKQGLIYRHKKLVNWDPVLKTAISNIEVIHKETHSKMYYFKYISEDKQDQVIVATTRPETMFGDVCLVVHPDDARFTHILNKKFVNPANDELLPVITDNYIDMEFGTGVMKCTPAHDFNDYEIGKRHKLDIINVLNDDATMNELAGKYNGMDRLACRKQLVADIEAKGLVDHIEDIVNQVGYSERTDAIVEPYLSWQWFVKMKPLAEEILKMQASDDTMTQFEPARFNNTLLQWLENIEDWCISRQLWWGHQIPIWYNKHTDEIYCDTVAPKDIENWVRDEDVLDTWFSSALWPMVTLGWPKKSELFEKYYPTDVLVTGYDIIFFWVSRMMMSGKHFAQEKPFKNVLIHGLIRDEQGRKMSKSLGNGIDPMDVIDEYGTDALRLFLTSTATLGEDLNYSPEKLKANWNFLNKLWNGARYVLQLLEDNVDYELTASDFNNLGHMDAWILSELNTLISDMTKNMDNFNFVVATKKLYDFVWNTFNNQYLEVSKIDIRNNSHLTKKVLLYVLKQILIMLHPLCPFVTESIYQMLPNKKLSIMIESWPKEVSINKDINYVNWFFEIIDSIRKFRADNNIKFKEALEVQLHSIQANTISNEFISFANYYLALVNAQIMTETVAWDNTFSLITTNFEMLINAVNLVDKTAELEKLTVLKAKLESEIQRSTGILSNAAFVQKAPAQKVELEQNKLKDYQTQLEAVLVKIQELSK